MKNRVDTRLLHDLGYIRKLITEGLKDKAEKTNNTKIKYIADNLLETLFHTEVIVQEFLRQDAEKKEKEGKEETKTCQT